MNEQEIILVGKIGFVSSVVLWLICTWRLVFHLCWTRRADEDRIQRRSQSWLPIFQIPTNGQQQRFFCARWITRRRIFHAMLWVATLCDVISYADLSEILPFTSDRILAENVGYVILNVLGRTIELLAFCAVTEIWLLTAIDARPRSMDSRISNQNFVLNWLPSIFLFFTILLVISSVFLSVDIFLRFPHAPNREYLLHMPLSMLQTILEATCWGLHASVVLSSVTITSNCILILIPSSEWKRRVCLLGKAVGPMLVSFLAYATRCIWLIVAYANQDRRDSWLWWISFVWVPTMTVSIMLLYSTRKRDSLVDDLTSSQPNNDENNTIGSDDDYSSQQPLLRPQPPEEAFRAFHSFQNGDDDANDLFSLGSPVPQNNNTKSHLEKLPSTSSTDAEPEIQTEINESAS